MKKKCEKGKAGDYKEDKKFRCQKCNASSNKKKKLCKPVKN